MNRKPLLLGGLAIVFVLAGCQPTTQDGGTGATPSGMPADTATTDTMMSDTLTSVGPSGPTGARSAYAAARI